ncbi:hypothetical protein ABW09_12030 [Pluralibacter gergoviae]|uniref:hypothetical protein n=1 Tax=Pluralibacter gergoviae TaxID=61647 RepID=UPI000650DDD3|nr:hypothetical protein [Pluralibacter gergoviae]KMK17769.1 hypothetical protein ABW09_12030 [Pluralibacter gergoviae]
MNKKQLVILERAWESEINCALNDSAPLIQTKSKIAAKLAEDGYLEWREIPLGGSIPIVIKGYQITHAGILEYCLSLPDDIDIDEIEKGLRV